MTEVFKQVICSDEVMHLGTLKPEITEVNDPLKEREESKKTGYQLGLKQGMTEGLQQAKEQAAKENAELGQQLSQLLKAIPHAVSENRLALKSEIADIVLAITQQFFVHQQQNKEVLSQQITAALNQINDKQNLTLVLNPQDLALLQQGELNIDLSQCKDISLQADENLQLGGCLIRSEHGFFDASIERQIDRLKQVLLQIRGQKRHD